MPGRPAIPTDTNRPWLLDKKFMERHRHELMAAASLRRRAKEDPWPEPDWEDEDDGPWDEDDGPWDQSDDDDGPGDRYGNRTENEGPWGQRATGS